MSVACRAPPATTRSCDRWMVTPRGGWSIAASHSRPRNGGTRRGHRCTIRSPQLSAPTASATDQRPGSGCSCRGWYPQAARRGSRSRPSRRPSGGATRPPTRQRASRSGCTTGGGRPTRGCRSRWRAARSPASGNAPISPNSIHTLFTLPEIEIGPDWLTSDVRAVSKNGAGQEMSKVLSATRRPTPPPTSPVPTLPSDGGSSVVCPTFRRREVGRR